MLPASEMTLAASSTAGEIPALEGYRKKTASMYCGNFGKSSWPMLPASAMTLAASSTAGEIPALNG